ncbi:MAG: VOC family protein [Lachnospiraceae bacterium]
MGGAEFLHVGITVSDMEQTIDFYSRYFGFTLGMKGIFEKEFIHSHYALYQLDEGAYSDFCFLESPNGFILEVF